jgi:hypothetical protein
MEVYCQLCIASDLKYITMDELESLKLNIDKISNKPIALVKAYNRIDTQKNDLTIQQFNKI